MFASVGVAASYWQRSWECFINNMVMRNNNDIIQPGLRIKHRAFIIDIYVTQDKEYCYPECKRLDGSLIHDNSAHDLYETEIEAQQAGKEIIDEFLDN